MRSVVVIGLLGLLAACASNEEVKQLQESQRQLQAKVAELEKKIDQAGKPAAPSRAQVDPNKVFELPAGNSPFKGPSDAPVVLTEFADFQCPFCGQVPAVVDQVLKAYPKEVKFVYKQMPLTSIHPFAMGASKAALAAQRQGKYWEMYDKLFANQRALQPEKLKDYAQEIGLDVAKFEKDMASPEVQQQIDDDMKLAQQVHVGGTPTLFLNGKRVMNRSADGIKQMVDDSLKQKG